MGSLAARGVAKSDWASVWKAVIVYFISSWHRTGGFAIGSRSGSVTVAVQGSGGELANAQTARQSVGGGEAKLVRRTEVSALAGKKVLGV